MVALQLANAGCPVSVALLGQHDRLMGEEAFHAARWTGEVQTVSPAAVQEPSLVVDALFVARLTRAMQDTAQQTLAAVVRKQILIVAIDVSSGLMGDSGKARGAVSAKLTVAFF